MCEYVEDYLGCCLFPPEYTLQKKEVQEEEKESPISAIHTKLKNNVFSNTSQKS